jgi:hypothetical protein
MLILKAHYTLRRALECDIKIKTPINYFYYIDRSTNLMPESSDVVFEKFLGNKDKLSFYIQFSEFKKKISLIFAAICGCQLY